MNRLSKNPLLLPTAVVSDRHITNNRLVKFLVREKGYSVRCLSKVEDFLAKPLHWGKFVRIFFDIKEWTDLIPSQIEQIIRQQPNCQLVLVTKGIAPKNLLQAISAGAMGCIVHGGNVRQISDDLETLDIHGSIISPPLLKYLCAFVQEKKICSQQSLDGTEIIDRRLPVENPAIQISSKQWRIMELLSKGETYHSASKQMGLKLDCFRYHIKKIYSVFNVNNKVSIVRKYLEMVDEGY